MDTRRARGQSGGFIIGIWGDFMGTLSPFHWLILLVIVVLFGWPIAKILQRMGVSPWWTVLAFFPLLNIFGLWALSAARWPKLDSPAS
jgi:hypothetical protein